MIRIVKVIAALVVAASATLAWVPTSSAEEGGDAETVVVGGRTYGPQDGVVVETQAVDVRPGMRTVGVLLGDGMRRATGVRPMASWGSSYATSTEIVQLYYQGKAKAAANIHGGKRIIRVCFWYSRGGSVISPTVCSNASSSTGAWRAGPEKRDGVWDSLDPNAPVTKFHYSITKINPNVV